MNKMKAEPKRIVVKVGTSSLIDKHGNININSIDGLAYSLTKLQEQGKEVILVSSGAIGVGIIALDLPCRPSSIPAQQAVAAVGQAKLMDIYCRYFQNYQQQTAQVLMTKDVVDYSQSRQNVTNTLEELLAMKIIPIVNENDVVTIDNLDRLTKFGDNDQLSAIVNELVDSDLLIVLSDVDGFYSANPAKDKTAKLHHCITNIDESLLQEAGGCGSQWGTGGMNSKLKAAKKVMLAGKTMILANGKDPRIILDIVKGKKVGTIFKKNTDLHLLERKTPQLSAVKDNPVFKNIEL